ncbi:MAG: OmpA family protein [Planctomycetota bacterium]|jgi:outer membrane protein OmpA-like peptidoglycan-associated protein
MGHDKREAAKQYTPADGDTLKSIAKQESTPDHPLTWQEIARFNWGTDNPNVVDEFLRDELGCYARGDDKHFIISDDVVVRTPLLIPQPFKKTSLATGQIHTLKVRKKEEPPKQFEGCSRIRGITFEFDSDKIRPTEVGDLVRVATEIEEHPDALAIVFGHTDKVGADWYNKGLSERRAERVYKYLTTESVPRIDKSRFMDPKHMGCGEFNPLKETEERHEPNRRVTVFLFNKERPPNLPCEYGSVAPCKHLEVTDKKKRHNESFRCSFYDSIAKECPFEGGGIGPSVKSTLQIVDEIGEPLKDTPVKVTLSDGQVIQKTTDTDGKIELKRPEGEEIEIEIDDIHEIAPTDSSKTASGQHFGANKSGP